MIANLIFIYNIIDRFTIDEINELLKIFDPYYIDSQLYYHIVDVLRCNKNWHYIKDKIEPVVYEDLILSNTIDDLILYNIEKNYFHWNYISTYTTISFTDIKKYHTLPWIFYDASNDNIGLFRNRHLYIANLAELFYEVDKMGKSELNFVANYFKYHNCNKDLTSSIASYINDRYDLTTELVKEYFKKDDYIFFVSHPAIDPFKLYENTDLKLPINDILGNPSLSYEVICKYIPLANNLSYLVTNEFDYSMLYKKVKLYKQKQDELNQIIGITRMPTVICGIIISYHVIIE